MKPCFINNNIISTILPVFKMPCTVMEIESIDPWESARLSTKAFISYIVKKKKKIINEIDFEIAKVIAMSNFSPIVFLFSRFPCPRCKCPQ